MLDYRRFAQLNHWHDTIFLCRSSTKKKGNVLQTDELKRTDWIANGVRSTRGGVWEIWAIDFTPFPARNLSYPMKWRDVMVARHVSVTRWRAANATSPESRPLAGSLAAQSESQLFAHLRAERLLITHAAKATTKETWAAGDFFSHLLLPARARCRRPAKVDRKWKKKTKKLAIERRYLLLLGIPLRVPAKLQNGHDDGHREPAQQDNKHAACLKNQSMPSMKKSGLNAFIKQSSATLTSLLASTGGNFLIKNQID